MSDPKGVNCGVSASFGESFLDVVAGMDIVWFETATDLRAQRHYPIASC